MHNEYDKKIIYPRSLEILFELFSSWWLKLFAIDCPFLLIAFKNWFLYETSINTHIDGGQAFDDRLSLCVPIVHQKCTGYARLLILR